MTKKSEAIETRFDEVDPKSLTLLEKNAHFMPERTFKQMVDNIKRDGALTSAPLVADVDGKMTVLSGNHRVKASLAAGLPRIPVIVIEGDLSDQRRISIQLSHNALVGDDDPNVLRELYDSLDVIEQRYSGLTDQDLGVLSDPDLQKLSVGLPQYDDVTIAFLPDDLVEFEDNLKKLSDRAEKHRVIFARFEHYHEFFEGVFKTKEAEKIGNDGIALLVMSQLALEYLNKREAEAEGDNAS